MNNAKQKIAVIGLGYVGLPLALLALKKGHEVIGIDLDTRKIEKINNGESPFLDEKITSDLQKYKLHVTSDFKAVENVTTVIICVPTPVHEDHTPDLSPVENSCKSIAKHLQHGQLIILESTVNPGVCDEVVIPLFHKHTDKKVGTDFYLAHCPERINPGDTKWNVENIPRVVGGFDAESLKRAAELYESIIDAPIKRMKTLKEAEAVKIVENSFRDINIAFVNELAMSFSKLGIDVVNVIQGSATKPFAFMAHYPGCGVGGHCIPVDPYYLIKYAKDNGFSHEFLELARKINNNMPRYAVQTLAGLLNTKNIPLKKAKVAVLGLAYKANVDDTRESPALEIVKHLTEEGATVTTFDPHAVKKSTAASLQDALKNQDGVIIATNHKEFLSITPTLLTENNIQAIVDGRNCLNPEAFIGAKVLYKGIGR